MKILLSVTLLLLCPIPSFAQLQAFIQAGVFAPSKHSGYTQPAPDFQGGLEYDGRKITSISRFDFSAAISKDNSPGLGYSVGGQSLAYWRLTRSISLGGGASATNLRMPIYAKGSLYAVGGIMIDGRAGRIFTNYFHNIAFDQNHGQAVKATWEIGRRRLQPTVTAGVEHFTEPSFCGGACVNHWAPLAEGGLRWNLGKAGK